MALFITGEKFKSTPELASHMLVFMARPVFKPSLSFAIAMYPSSCITGEKLFPVVWEVIETLEINFLPVISVTSDGASPNRRFYKLCKDRGIDYKTRNPFSPDRYIYFFCDPPHLLKTAHNCFSNSYSHSKNRKLQVSSTTKHTTMYTVCMYSTQCITNLHLHYRHNNFFCWS